MLPVENYRGFNCSHDTGRTIISKTTLIDLPAFLSMYTPRTDRDIFRHIPGLVFTIACSYDLPGLILLRLWIIFILTSALLFFCAQGKIATWNISDLSCEL